MTNWIEEIAKNSGEDKQKVEKILDKYKIKFYSTEPVTKNLLISKLTFSGTKLIDTQEIPFEYTKTFTSGIWCITVNDNLEGKSNLIGKSSILDIILWMLSGKRSRIQDDVYVG